MKKIVLREHERIPVAEYWDSGKRTVGKKQLEIVLSHQDRHAVKLFEPGFRCLKATSWVGSLGLGEHCLDVLPKIDDDNSPLDENRTRLHLLWMVTRAGLVPLVEADIAPLARSPKTLLVAFLQLYVQKLTLEWRRGPIRHYMADEQSRTYLRGKLLFSEQLRHNPFQKHRFFTRSDEFAVDNPLSALLKAALRTCAQQTFSMDVAREAKCLLIDFTEVGDRTFSQAELEQIAVSRQHRRFTLLIRLAKMILAVSSPGRTDGGVPIYSMMFDMNVVFERFVASVLQRAVTGTDLKVRVQLGGRSLLLKGDKPQFQLKPDIGIFRGKELVCLIDTKWKRLDPQKIHCGVSQADMYQMYAYGKEFASTLTILLYPQWGRLPEKVASYTHPVTSFGEIRQIRVATLAISHSDGSIESELKLKNDLMNLIVN